MPTSMTRAIPAAVASVLADAVRGGSPRMRRMAASARDLFGTTRTGGAAGTGASRIRSISRHFDAGSTATGARSSLMSIASGSGAGRRSDTIHPLKDLTQSLARPLHTHLERRDARARDGSYLLVAQPFDVVQQERFPLISPQLVERPRHLFTERRPFFRVRLRGFGKYGVRLIREHFLPPPADGAHGAGAVHENAEEPRAKPLPLLVPPQGPIGAQEGILHDLFGILAIADEMNGEADVVIEVALDQDRERFDLSVQHSFDYGRVGFHREITRRLQSGSHGVPWQSTLPHTRTHPWSTSCTRASGR